MEEKEDRKKNNNQIMIVNNVDVNKENLNVKTQKSAAKESLWQVVKFTLFSISAGVIQLGLTYILELIGLNNKGEFPLYWLAYLIGLVASVVWNFTFNRKYTFKSAENVPIAMTLVFFFYLIFTPMSLAGAHLLSTRAGWPELVVTPFIMIINFVTEFLYDRFIVFGNSINTNNLAKAKTKNDKFNQVDKAGGNAEEAVITKKDKN